MYEEKKGRFVLRDILIQLAFVLLLAGLLIWLFPTKSFFEGRFADLNSKVDVLMHSIFADNIDRMRVAAVSYYTIDRLPKRTNEMDSMTLREMLNKKLLIEFVDSNGNSCDLDQSYVEVIRLDEEWQLKINLVCTDKEGYIIVHLGCYDYCKTPVCEKRVEKPTPTPTKPVSRHCRYEYARYSDCNWGNWGPWSSWSTTPATQTPYRRVESRTQREVIGTEQVQTGQVMHFDNSKRVTNTNWTCPQGTPAGNNTCRINTTDTVTATCNSGFTLTNGVCRANNATGGGTHIVSLECPSGWTRNGATCSRQVSGGAIFTYANKVCPSGFTRSGNTCTRAGTTTYTKGSFIGTQTFTSHPANTNSRIFEFVSQNYVFSCSPSPCAMRWVFTYRVYNAVAVTSGGQTAALVCPSGFSEYGHATQCRQQTGVGNATETRAATCPSGFTPVAGTTTCSRRVDGTHATHTPNCPAGFTRNGNICTGGGTATVPATPVTTFSCTGGYTLNAQNNCFIFRPTFDTINIYGNVTSWRFSTRECIGGGRETRWSNSNRDTALLNQGFGLTGHRVCH